MALGRDASRVSTTITSHGSPIDGTVFHTVFVHIAINVNQRLVVQLAHGDGVSRPLSVEWQRRPSDRYSWDGPNVERKFIGRARLDTSGFEVRP